MTNSGGYRSAATVFIFTVICILSRGAEIGWPWEIWCGTGHGSKMVGRTKLYHVLQDIFKSFICKIKTIRSK